jgi:hypothetical protein
VLRFRVLRVHQAIPTTASRKSATAPLRHELENLQQYPVSMLETLSVID